MAETAPAAPAKVEAKKESPASKVEAMVASTAGKLRKYIWDKVRYVFSGKWLPWAKKK